MGGNTGLAGDLVELGALHGLPPDDGFLGGGVAKRLYEGALSEAGDGEFAVFAYGSLMWAPEFRPTFESRARVYGLCRRPCIYSTTYRGTPERPGLVFGLDAGGSCTGFALGMPRRGRARLIRDLFLREMFQGVYYPLVTAAHLEGGGTCRCLTFVANRASPAYAPPLPAATLREIVGSASGLRGPCLDYWRQTLRLLRDHGIAWDPGLELPEA